MRSSIPCIHLWALAPLPACATPERGAFPQHVSARDTEHSVLHAVIREHLEPFLREVSDRGDGHGLPRFVEQEFREFLTCGVLAYGFTRLRCRDCTLERLVPFSCKRRGFCPNCGGRRMAERAAYSRRRGAAAGVGAPVGPNAAVSPALPAGLGSRLVPRGPGRVCSRAPRLLRAHGPLTRHPQRPDRDGHGDTALRQRPPTQWPLPHAGARRRLQRSSARAAYLSPRAPPSHDDVAHVLATVRARVGRLLSRRHLEPADDTAPADPLAHGSPVLAGLVGASVQGRVALGPCAGKPDLGHVISRPASGPGRRLRPPRLRLGPLQQSRSPGAALSLSAPLPTRPGPHPPPRRRACSRQAQDGLARWHPGDLSGTWQVDQDVHDGGELTYRAKLKLSFKYEGGS